MADVGTSGGGFNISGAGSSPNPDAAGNDLSTATKDAKAAKGVAGACKGGGCQKGTTGQNCEFLSQINAVCQKAMAPYSDSCSSCGGSGVEGGAPPSNSSSSSGEEDSTDNSETGVFELCYIFNSLITQFPIPSSSSTEAASYTTTGIVRLDNWDPAATSNIFISETDTYGINAVPLFDALKEGDSLTLERDSTLDPAYAVFKYVSQIDNGTYRAISVTPTVSLGSFENGEKLLLGVSRVIARVTSGVQLNPCPDCGGTGLEGSTGGIEGIIMAVYNGSAEFSGVSHIDIYGVVQSS